MEDGFSTEERKAAWWATDSRRSVSGQLVDVIREKRGEVEREDLSHIEAVQMGLTMQPVIGKLFEQQTGIRVRDLDIAGTHPVHTWMRAHGDFETSDGGLLEVKNFHAASLNKYPDMDSDGLSLPEPDIVQCIHESCVFNKPHVWFAVLFGGQRFRYWKITVTEEMKEDFIKRAAKWWAQAQNGVDLDPETVDQARYVWQKDDGTSIVATEHIEHVAIALKSIKTQIKMLEEKEAQATLILQKYMQDHSEIRTVSGQSLVSWKAAKPSMKFSASLFKSSQPDLYEQFVVEQPGSRRFLVK